MYDNNVEGKNCLGSQVPPPLRPMGNIGLLNSVSAISPYYKHILKCFLTSLGECWFILTP